MGHCVFLLNLPHLRAYHHKAFPFLSTGVFFPHTLFHQAARMGPVNQHACKWVSLTPQYPVVPGSLWIIQSIYQYPSCVLRFKTFNPSPEPAPPSCPLWMSSRHGTHQLQESVWTSALFCCFYERAPHTFSRKYTQLPPSLSVCVTRKHKCPFLPWGKWVVNKKREGFSEESKRRVNTKEGFMRKKKNL